MKMSNKTKQPRAIVNIGDNWRIMMMGWYDMGEKKRGRTRETKKRKRRSPREQERPRGKGTAGNTLVRQTAAARSPTLSVQGPPETNAGIRLIISILFILLCRRGIELFRVVECPPPYNTNKHPTLVQLPMICTILLHA